VICASGEGAPNTLPCSSQIIGFVSLLYLLSQYKREFFSLLIPKIFVNSCFQYGLLLNVIVLIWDDNIQLNY